MTINTNELETVPCELCGANQPVPMFTAPDRLHGLPGRFSVVQCKVCGLIYLNPRPVNWQAYYPENGYAAHAGTGSGSHFSAAPWRSAGLRQRCRAVLARKHTGRLLDIGCGAGDFLHAMSQLTDWEVQGLEPSPAAAIRARQVYGLDVLTGQLGEIAIPDASFDVITLWHVLEHLPHPRAALREITRILRPNGIVVLACPIADSWEARTFGPYWSGYDVPRHLYTFSRQTLGRLLNECGLNCEESYGIVAGFNSLRISVAFWLNERFPQIVRARLLHTIAINLIAVPMYAILRLQRATRGPGVATFYATLDARARDSCYTWQN